MKTPEICPQCGKKTRWEYVGDATNGGMKSSTISRLFRCRECGIIFKAYWTLINWVKLIELVKDLH